MLLEWIKRTRMQKQEAAALIGISKATMSKLLTGYRLPNLPLAVKIEVATGISVESWLPTSSGKLGKPTRKPRQTHNVSAA